MEKKNGYKLLKMKRTLKNMILEVVLLLRSILVEELVLMVTLVLFPVVQ